MIAKGNLHGGGGKLAAYLVTGKDGERAELVELSMTVKEMGAAWAQAGGLLALAQNRLYEKSKSG